MSQPIEKEKWVFPDDDYTGEVTLLEQWGSRPFVVRIGKVVKMTTTQVIAVDVYPFQVNRFHRSTGRDFGQRSSRNRIEPTTDEHRAAMAEKIKAKAERERESQRRKAQAETQRAINLQTWAKAIQEARTPDEAIELLEDFHGRAITGDISQPWPLLSKELESPSAAER